MPRRGSTATDKMITPMPPTHWVKPRHTPMLRGRSAGLATTVEPVVVKPDTVSKKASVMLGIVPVNR